MLKLTLNLKPFIVAILLAGAVSVVHGQNQAQNGDNVWSLQECMQYALSNSLVVKRSELQFSADRALAFQSKAQILPTISGNANYFFSSGRTLDQTTQRYINTQNQNSNVGLNGGIILFSGGQRIRSIQQTKTTAEASSMDLLQSRNNVSLDVGVNYLQVLNNAELVTIARNQVEVSRQQAERTEKLVNAGSVAQTELLNLQAQLAKDQASLTTAQNNLDIAKLTLMQSMNLPAQENFEIEGINLAEPTINNYEKTAAQVYETALQTQYSVKSADLKVKSSQFNLLATKGAYFPTLTIGGSIRSNFNSRSQRLASGGSSTPPQINPDQVVGFVGGDPDFVVLKTPISQGSGAVYESIPYFDQIRDNRGQSFGFSLDVPILNGWQTRTQVSRAVIQQKTTELDAQNVRVQLRQDIEQAYNNMEAAASQYLSNKQQVESLDLAFKATESRFNVGLVNSVDYSVAKANLDQARANLIQSKYNYYFRLKILDFYQNKPITF